MDVKIGVTNLAQLSTCLSVDLEQSICCFIFHTNRPRHFFCLARRIVVQCLKTGCDSACKVFTCSSVMATLSAVQAAPSSNL